MVIDMCFWTPEQLVFPCTNVFAYLAERYFCVHAGNGIVVFVWRNGYQNWSETELLLPAVPEALSRLNDCTWTLMYGGSSL